MSGTINISLTQQFDSLGKPLSGGLLYFFEAASSTPQNAYKDTALTLAHPNPITLDSTGRVPSFYLADGNIRVRLTDSLGNPQFDESVLLVVGPSSGSGSGTTVDPNTIFATGDVMWQDVSGARAGWVRDNGRTIGSATSGASERANADCEGLFEFLWSKYSDTLCPVIGGRGVSAAADWSANKQITLPDKRGYAPGGLDDMGNTAAGRYASVPVVSGSVTTAGSVIGENLNTILTANLPPYTPAGTVASTIESVVDVGVSAFTASSTGGGVSAPNVFNSSPTITSEFTGTPQGGTSSPHNTVQETVLGTFYRKL